jgi:hypothetical protein
LKTGEEKGLCPAGLDACSVLGTPGGYEVCRKRSLTDPMCLRFSC